MKIASTPCIKVTLEVLLVLFQSIFARKQCDKPSGQVDTSLISIKEWFKKISDPTTKCIESENEPEEGMIMYLVCFKRVIFLKKSISKTSILFHLFVDISC